MSDPKPKPFGWVYPTPHSRKAHFIDDGRSLCGNWLYLGRAWISPPADDRCKRCKRRMP